MTNRNNLLIRIASALGGAALIAGTVFAAGASAQAATIGSQLSLGSRGTDVSALQSLLATNSMIYPEGLVTGYYGQLTASAVSQFQAAYGLPQVGRVGPMTLAKLNSIVNSGLGLDTAAPVMSNSLVLTGRTSATLSWNTSELSRARVFYSTFPISATETTANFAEPAISGTVVDSSAFQYSQSVTIPNLNPGTAYYYMVESIDRSGNVTVWPYPAGTFVTNS